jgi:hypothetical protein
MVDSLLLLRPWHLEWATVRDAELLVIRKRWSRENLGDPPAVPIDKRVKYVAMEMRPSKRIF